MSGSLNQFRTLIQTMAQTAIQIAGDVAEAVVYTQVTATTYNPATGMNTNTTTTFNLMGIPDQFGANEVDGKIVIVNDAKLVVAYLDLPITPTTEDTLTVLGATWKVQRVIGTPAQGVWTLHIRQV